MSKTSKNYWFSWQNHWFFTSSFTFYFAGSKPHLSNLTSAGYIPSLTSNEGLVQNQRTAQQWLELRTLLLEWTNSHQCTSCGWARWGRFSDEWKSHPPCPHIYFFPTSSLPQNFPPSYLPPTNPSPPPHSIAKAPETSSGSELGAGELGGEVGAGGWSSKLGARE